VLAPEAVDEIRRGTRGGGSLPTAWLWWVRTVLLLAIVGVLLLNLNDIFLTPESGYYIVPGPLR
jgi:NSS family neurotransmitter:Na+ symporter